MRLAARRARAITPRESYGPMGLLGEGSAGRQTRVGRRSYSGLMASPVGPTKHKTPSEDFRSMSDQDFARLSTEEKLRHLHLGTLDLAQALDELAVATTGRDRLYGQE